MIPGSRSKILVLLGSTATGKTDLALSLAKKFKGELVSCDSRQVYKGLDIGTGKMPIIESTIKKGEGWWEVNGIKIWMYDVLNPKKQYTVADYVGDAGKVIREIWERRILPIVAGGTGLYLKAILDGLSNLSIPVDNKLRKRLDQLTVSQLQERLKQISAERWERMNYSDAQNPRRLIRAIEILLNSNLAPSPKLWSVGDKSPARGEARQRRQISKLHFKSQNYGTLKIGLTAERKVLYHRADDRVVNRMKQGMIEEAERLRNTGLSLERMRQLGLEYGFLADFLDAKIKTKAELIKIIQRGIHGYIRRQLTWFKKETDINWFDLTTDNYLNKIEKLVKDWYNQK